MSRPAAGLPPAHELVERALKASTTQGCAVIVEESSDAEIRFANNTTTTNGVRRDRRVTVISFCAVEGGISAGVARQGGDVDVASLVAAAESDGAGSPAAEDAAPLLEGAIDADFAEPAPANDFAVLRPAVDGLAGAFERAGRDDRVLAGFAEHHLETVFLGTSSGLRRRHVQPTGDLHLVARSGDGRRSAWAGVGTADFTDVTIETLEERLVGRLRWAERTVELPAGRYEVVLPPDAVADMMAELVFAASGQEAEEGRTVFSAAGGGTRVGDQLSPLPFDLWSDPNEPGLECEPFLTTAWSGPDVSVFDNGMALSRTDWVAGGHLRHLRYHRAGAARSGVEPAAPIDNLVLALPGASGTLEEMVARTDRGLLLTCLWYIREVDPATLLLTGLTRDGVYLIEGGEVVGAVNNFRFNESPVDLLKRATEAGTTVRALGRELGEWVNRTAMPPLRIPEFNMSSVSQAS